MQLHGRGMKAIRLRLTWMFSEMRGVCGSKSITCRSPIALSLDYCEFLYVLSFTIHNYIYTGIVNGANIHTYIPIHIYVYGNMHVNM